jgi:hypothetical protein
MNPEPRQNDGPTSLSHLFREIYDLVDEAVASTTDEQIEDRLRTVLSRAGYSEEAADTGTEPDRRLPVPALRRGRGPSAGPDIDDDPHQLVFAKGELVCGHERDVERAKRVLDLQLAERALALREREVALHAQKAEIEERRAEAEHRRRIETIEVEAKVRNERREPVRRMFGRIVVATVTVGGYTVAAVFNAVSLPVLSISFAILIYLSLVLVVTHRATRGSSSERQSAYRVLQVLWPFHRMILWSSPRKRRATSAKHADDQLRDFS